MVIGQNPKVYRRPFSYRIPMYLYRVRDKNRVFLSRARDKIVVILSCGGDKKVYFCLLNKIEVKNLFKQIIVERQDWLKNIKVSPRDIEIEKEVNYVFTGLRRAGKSYFLYQLIKNMTVENQYDRVLMINFEDERLLEVTHRELHLILESYYELFDMQPVIFLDEIQNVQHWQKFVRRLADNRLRVYVTGSNADMLSHEIATTLGGRFMIKEILPLSFKEFLNFQRISYSGKHKFSEDRFTVIRAYDDYLKFGGFPELLKFENKREFLSGVYQKLFYGDLIARYKLSNDTALKLLIKKLAESVNNETSVTRIKNLIKSTGLSIGNNTVFDYLSYLEKSYLIASISNYNAKFSEKHNNRKYYFLDTGILGLFLHNQDTKLLENQVYIGLRRKGYEMFFLKRNTKVDFFVPDHNLLMQVSYSIEDKETFERELHGLATAMEKFEIDEGYIITRDEEKTIEINEGSIHIVPAHKWLLEE